MDHEASGLRACSFGPQGSDLWTMDTMIHGHHGPWGMDQPRAMAHGSCTELSIDSMDSIDCIDSMVSMDSMDPMDSMEFHGLHGIPWNAWSSMESIEFHRIQWNSTESI